jgi:hypothetical protein
MTPPLVPVDVVIPRLPWVPVYADRLWSSNFFAVASDAEFRAAFCLWLKSWTQTPPGSLPNDDRILCRLAELGGNLARWNKVKRIALRHWIECDDGRLYHPVIAELVLDANLKLNANQQRTMNATKNRWKSTKPGIRNGIRNGHDLEGTGNPPLNPPHDGGGDQQELFAVKSEVKNGDARAPPAKPVNPKLLNHGDFCQCANCQRWYDQKERIREYGR